MKHGLSEMGLKLQWPAAPRVRGILVASRTQLPSVPTVAIVLELVEAPVEVETPKEIAAEALNPQPAAPEPREVPVKVLPPREKRQRRAPKVEDAPAAPPTPKPLKVIRRRKEEAPKIFETPPKEFPEAILSAFHLRPDDPGK